MLDFESNLNLLVSFLVYVRLVLLTLFFRIQYREESDTSTEYYMCVDSDNDNDLVMCGGSEIYTLKAPLHILCLVLNIILPGWGTMLSACACLHAVKEHKSMSCSCGTFMDGFF